MKPSDGQGEGEGERRGKREGNTQRARDRFLAILLQNPHLQYRNAPSIPRMEFSFETKNTRPTIIDFRIDP